MNRNAESPFSMAPISLDLPRNTFNRNNKHLTTCNAADLNICHWDWVLPGDTFNMNMAAAIRMTTPIFPVMDNCYADFYWFFVPYRLVWEHFANFMGQNDQTAWEQQTEYEVPQIAAPDGGWEVGTIADQIGIPTGVDGFTVNALPFRAYALIYNEWFRNQNTNDPVMVNKDETQVTGTNATDQPTINAQLGAYPLKACKFMDYFTAALPEAQKGAPVTIPIVDITGTGAVYGNGKALGLEGKLLDGTIENWGLGTRTSGGVYKLMPELSYYDSDVGTGISGTETLPKSDTSMGITTDKTKSGMVADINTTATPVTISALRTAFQIQKYYEKQALYGSRYTESVAAFFGTRSPDARLQRPEYLGGCRMRINMDQVIQTSASQQQTGLTSTPQGNAAAYSLTNYYGNQFTHSFTEHGYIMCLYTIRQHHTYSQGLERELIRKDIFDFYNPVFASISNQPIYNKEIYLQSDEEVDEDGNIINDKAFGYQEAWADYRYKQDRISGKFRSTANGTLDSWHYGDYYTELPLLSAEWMNETDENIQRTLAVDNEPQFICDFKFENTCRRVMPLYSIPGLIDHH